MYFLFCSCPNMLGNKCQFSKFSHNSIVSIPFPHQFHSIMILIATNHLHSKFLILAFYHNIPSVTYSVSKGLSCLMYHIVHLSCVCSWVPIYFVLGFGNVLIGKIECLPYIMMNGNVPDTLGITQYVINIFGISLSQIASFSWIIFIMQSCSILSHLFSLPLICRW